MREGFTPGKVDLSVMTNYRAIGVIEGWLQSDGDSEVIAAWQHLVNTGFVHYLLPAHVCEAERLIKEGKVKDNSGNFADDGEGYE